MAEELQYSSGNDSATNKRKYEDQLTTPPSAGTRRPTGFSAPISSQSPDSGNPPSSYNSVPPPVDEIQLAKQKAQEIAARLFNNAEAKRPRVENGGGGFDSNDVKGFSSVPTEYGQKPMIPNMNPSSIPVSYGFQTSKKIDIPNGRVGVIIGKSGETIKYLQLQSGAKIQVTRDMDADPNSLTRMVELTGTQEQIDKAEQFINDVLAEAEAGGSGIVSRRVTGQQAGSEQFVMFVPNNKVGLVIGKGGETIKNMQASSGARIQVIPLHLAPGDTSTERKVQIDGTSEQVETAKQLVNEVISQNPRMRNPAMAGGYPQQGYQAQAPTSWASSTPQMQQSGYGYAQPGAYTGPTPQYGMTQPPYTGYPQQATSGGYATGWDQTAAPPNQQTAQGGYDYYSQQPPQQQASGGSSAPADNTSYGYNQPQASGYNQQGQGYPHNGYGGYNAPAAQPGYGQQQPNPHTGYEQQHGYNSTTGYGNVTNPTPDGQAPSYGAQGDTNQAPPPVQSSAMGQQGYSAGQQPSSSPASYPPQGSTQPGYGVPPTSQTGYGTQQPTGYAPNYGTPQAQKPPANQTAYGQAQQSPGVQGGYVQPGYPHSQPAPTQSGYAQTDSGAQRAPPSGYGTATAQPGYGAPPYGAPPVAQPGYGQQQQPPPYNSSYGGGYSQAPAYPTDGSAAPASQAVQSGSVAKTSPQG